MGVFVCLFVVVVFVCLFVVVFVCCCICLLLLLLVWFLVVVVVSLLGVFPSTCNYCHMKHDEEDNDYLLEDARSPSLSDARPARNTLLCCLESNEHATEQDITAVSDTEVSFGFPDSNDYKTNISASLL